jgi:hypothetical protein
MPKSSANSVFSLKPLEHPISHTQPDLKIASVMWCTWSLHVGKRGTGVFNNDVGGDLPAYSARSGSCYI